MSETPYTRGNNLTSTVWLPNETATPVAPALGASTGTAPQLTQGATALKPAAVIGIDRLYEAPKGTKSNMILALELLKESYTNLSKAQNSASALDADLQVQHVQSALPKLFACRSIGDGFAASINAIHYAFVNQHGKPLAKNQLNAMWRVMRDLHGHPVISLEQSIRHAEELESQGLAVDPPRVGEVLEAIESVENG